MWGMGLQIPHSVTNYVLIKPPTSFYFLPPLYFFLGSISVPKHNTIFLFLFTARHIGSLGIGGHFGPCI